MDKVVNEIRYQFVVCVRINQIKTPLPDGCVPNRLRCQILETLRDFIPNSVVHTCVLTAYRGGLPFWDTNITLIKAKFDDLDVGAINTLHRPMGFTDHRDAAPAWMRWSGVGRNF